MLRKEFQPPKLMCYMKIVQINYSTRAIMPCLFHCFSSKYNSVALISYMNCGTSRRKAKAYRYIHSRCYTQHSMRHTRLIYGKVRTKACRKSVKIWHLIEYFISIQQPRKWNERIYSGRSCDLNRKIWMKVNYCKKSIDLIK